MVAALSATEKALDGLPIPAAKTCISLVLKIIETTDVRGCLSGRLKHTDSIYVVRSQLITKKC